MSRPKSIATVVVVLLLTFEVSSTPSDTLVIAASALSGSISEIEPTKVVLPTAKPPATTIFTGRGAAVSGSAGASEGLETIEHPFQQLEVGTLARVVRTVEVKKSVGHQIAGQHPGAPEGKLEVGRDLGDGDRLGTEANDLAFFERHLRRSFPARARYQQYCLDREIGGRTRATTGHRVRPNPESVLFAFRTRAHRGSAPCSSARNSGVSTVPARS